MWRGRGGEERDWWMCFCVFGILSESFWMKRHYMVLQDWTRISSSFAFIVLLSGFDEKYALIL